MGEESTAIRRVCASAFCDGCSESSSELRRQFVWTGPPGRCGLYGPNLTLGALWVLGLCSAALLELAPRATRTWFVSAYLDRRCLRLRTNESGPKEFDRLLLRSDAPTPFLHDGVRTRASGSESLYQVALIL